MFDRSSEKPFISLLIVDLDNTLYDWVAFFVPAFRAMISKASAILGVGFEALELDLREVAIRRRSTEFPFALLETDIVKTRLSKLNRSGRFLHLQPAFQAFNDERDRHLVLFPSVRKTLRIVKTSGCRVVAYSDADRQAAAKRLKLLHIEKYFDLLVAPERNELPHPAHPLRVQERIEEFAPLEPKPSIGTLVSILHSVNVTADRCLVVGDSLSRDIAPALCVGTHTLFAEYGAHPDPELFAELLRYTHLDKRSAVAETSKSSVSGEGRIERFDEILAAFDFGADPEQSASPSMEPKS